MEFNVKIESEMFDKAAEYYGFVLTGNRFLQLPDDVKENAHKDLLNMQIDLMGK